jgi:mono/diheme cytochrome c family protein
MRRRVGILSGILTAILTAVLSGVPAMARQNAVQTSPSSSPAQTIREFTNQYCVTCHNGRLKTAGLALDARDFEHLAADADVWERVIRKVQVGMMPPGGVPQPDAATRRAVVTALSGALDEAHERTPIRVVPRFID